jgi:hypothetical protein
METLMQRFLALAALAALTAATPALAATNLVTNGSFEAGLASWTIGGTDTDNPPRPPVAIFYNQAQAYPIGAFGEAVPNDNAVGSLSPDIVGDRALYFVSDFTVDQSVSQKVFLTAGNYEIGFSAYAPQNGYSNPGEAFFFATIAGVTLADYAVSTGPVTTWQHFGGTATIVADGLYDVAFVFNTNRRPSKDIVIDRVYILAGGDGGPEIPVVPEPATWALMIMGFGLVGAGLRRRRTVAAHG